MCNHYVSPEARDIERYWQLHPGNTWPVTPVFPRSQGPFIRAEGGSHERELVFGQWGLIPWFAKMPKLTYSTNNARSEELGSKATFKHPWSQGKRCIIPALSFDEPCWETGRNTWWQFRRADKALWGLAGLWNAWTDKATGGLFELYDVDLERRRMPADETHAQARPEARAGRAGQAQRGAPRVGRRRRVAARES